MLITTCRAGASDAGLLHELAARTFGLACPPGTRPADIEAFVTENLSTDCFAAYLSDPHRIVLLVAAEAQPVGYAMLVRQPITDPDVAAVVDRQRSIELSKFYLLPERHGRGVATVLMAATLAAAAETGARWCWLGVNQHNARAARFYAKHGFEVVGVKRFRVGDQWHDDHVRVRALSLPADAAATI